MKIAQGKVHMAMLGCHTIYKDIKRIDLFTFISLEASKHISVFDHPMLACASFCQESKIIQEKSSFLATTRSYIC